MTTSLSPSERSYIITGLSHPTSPSRLDGRTLLDTRPIQISYGDAPQASGSARVVLAGGTEVVAGIRLEVVDVTLGESKGKEGWRARVEVDVAPQAYPSLPSSTLQTLSTQYASLLTDHFIPALPPLRITPTKYFLPSLHLTLLSASSGSVPSMLLIAARAAFCDLCIPKTKVIGWEGAVNNSNFEGGGEETDLSGIKGAVRAGGRGRGKKAVAGGDEWDLDGDEGEVVEGREELPALVTLNLVPGSSAIFLDPTPQEESACPDRLHLFFTGQGKLCGLRMEGAEGLDVDRVKPLLLEGKRIAAELVDSLNASIPK